MRPLRIGLIGDFDPTVTAHRAIPLALGLVAERLSQPLQFDWLATDALPDAATVAGYDGLWCVPASPYRDMDGVLRAIGVGREKGVPFLGTCGGFQHALIEYARNVQGWADADHAETAPSTTRPVIQALACALVETDAAVRLVRGSRIAAAYDSDTAVASYHCSYGLASEAAVTMLGHGLNASAFDAHGEVRAVELDEHPFFVCTLFQPEREALRGVAPPLVLAFVSAARGA